MKVVVWLLRGLVFILLVILAIWNRQDATFSFPGIQPLTEPLIVIGLGFFVVGLLLGLLSAAPHYVRVRFENGRLKRDLHSARNPSSPNEPPIPPVM